MRDVHPVAAPSGVERHAIVGGQAWLAGWVSLANGLARAEIRHFPLSEEAAAWAFIGAEPAVPDRFLPCNLDLGQPSRRGRGPISASTCPS